MARQAIIVDGKNVDWKEVDFKQTKIFNLDASPENQDWIKTLSWDLPAYKSDEFMAGEKDLEAFRKLPIYKSAVKHGLIVNDEWTGPAEGYCRIVPRRDNKD